MYSCHTEFLEYLHSEPQAVHSSLSQLCSRWALLRQTLFIFSIHLSVPLPLSASADDDQAFDAGEGSGKRSGPADGEPESEPCQRGGLHLETPVCLCVKGQTGDPYRKHVVKVGNDHQTSTSAFIHLPPGDTWDQPDYTFIFRVVFFFFSFPVCLFICIMQSYTNWWWKSSYPATLLWYYHFHYAKKKVSLFSRGSVT